jgi:FtsH-binding integral membrane protein
METPAISVKAEHVNPDHVTAERISSSAASRKSSTPASHRFLQRYFYFVMSLLLATLVVSGFQRTVNANLFHPAIPRPMILWFHAAAFAAWILFFIAQSTLVRIRKVAWHRVIGWFGAGLAAVMVLLGVTTAIVMARFDTFRLHQTGADAFLSVPFYDMITFGTLVGLAILWRKRPEFHRRLIFIATCGLMDAALGRFDFIFDNSLFYLCIDLLILLGVARDFYLERGSLVEKAQRVHKVYLYALPLLIVGQSLTLYLWRHNPAWWQEITHVIMG